MPLIDLGVFTTVPYAPVYSTQLRRLVGDLLAAIGDADKAGSTFVSAYFYDDASDTGETIAEIVMALEKALRYKQYHQFSFHVGDINCTLSVQSVENQAAILLSFDYDAFLSSKSLALPEDIVTFLKRRLRSLCRTEEVNYIFLDCDGEFDALYEQLAKDAKNGVFHHAFLLLKEPETGRISQYYADYDLLGCSK